MSSPQLDRPERGFSFTREGPLDMRMDPTAGRTALDLLRDLDVTELAEVLRDYGEERYHKKIARLIKEALAADRITTTLDLAAVVAGAIPAAEQRKSRIHPATRTFQALRIAVNAELDQLERFLAVFPELLRPGGRCVVISFHSLEDRLVKRRFRDLAWTSSLPPALRRPGRRAGRRGVRAADSQGGGRRRGRDRSQPARPLGPPPRLRAHRRPRSPRPAIAPTVTR